MSEKDFSLPAQFDLTLLANFVHQVVNPLNGVAGTLDNLVTGVIEGSRREQRLNAARAQLEQCITLMRNLAFLAQGSGGVADDDRRIVVLPQAIIESAMYYQEEGESRRIKISLLDRATQNRVSGHPELIRQVLMNIFDNCIKYGSFNSTIEINQWIQSGSSDAIITIKGNSKVPIRPDEIGKMFDLGFRGSNARQVVASGTGLGLYICKQIIEKVHLGSLSVQNDGPGAVIYNQITARAEGERALAKTTISDTVIILDDEVYNITWMMDYLYSKGVGVVPAASANEAMDLVIGDVYRAAIIDLNVPILPPLDSAAADLGPVYITYPGLFVARAARNRGYRGRQVIIYSVHRNPEVAEEARKLGCTYILKGGLER